MKYLSTSKSLFKFQKEHSLEHSKDVFADMKKVLFEKFNLLYIGYFETIDGNKICMAYYENYDEKDNNVKYLNWLRVSDEIIDFIINEGIITDMANGFGNVHFFAKSKAGIIIDLFVVNVDGVDKTTKMLQKVAV
jgi:hypothetical protein